jgi:hypothetical protein
VKRQMLKILVLFYTCLNYFFDLVNVLPNLPISQCIRIFPRMKYLIIMEKGKHNRNYFSGWISLVLVLVENSGIKHYKFMLTEQNLCQCFSQTSARKTANEEQISTKIRCLFYQMYKLTCLSNRRDTLITIICKILHQIM